jgi:hypothetical protein
LTYRVGMFLGLNLKPSRKARHSIHFDTSGGGGGIRNQGAKMWPKYKITLIHVWKKKEWENQKTSPILQLVEYIKVNCERKKSMDTF